MIYKNFEQLKARVRRFTGRKKVAVVIAEEEHTLQAILKGRRENIIEPILIGDSEKIAELLKTLAETVPDEAIIHAKSSSEAALRAVEIINQQEADFLLKTSAI